MSANALQETVRFHSLQLGASLRSSAPAKKAFSMPPGPLAACFYYRGYKGTASDALASVFVSLVSQLLTFKRQLSLFSVSL
uniref:Uncharacterized protein n=1 Tax=Anguilla anguilla TaxID=7936 RepID=A0A0E9RD79_ANGAN